MLRFYAEKFVGAMALITWLRTEIADYDESKKLPPERADLLHESLGVLLGHLEAMKLPISQKSVKRLQDHLKAGEQFGILKTLLDHVSFTIKSELEDILLFQIPNHLALYYQSTEPLFGEEVSIKFPSAVFDIEESGKCFALARNTACVFHLMRVMECGLRVLGQSLNDPNLDPKKNPTWERILQRGDKELQAPYAQRTPEWQAHQQFFAEATANLRAVKDAWRNPTLHVEQFYDEEKVVDVWNAVRGFMRHLATVLSE